MDVIALSDLLVESRQAQEKEELIRQELLTTQTDTHFITNHVGLNNNINNDEENIWEDDQVPLEEESVNAQNDNRPEPQHNIYYRQQMGTQDIFFNLPGNSCHTSLASHIVIKIYFPGCALCDLNFQVTNTRLQAESRDA